MALPHVLDFSSPFFFFVTHSDFPLPLLYAPGSLRVGLNEPGACIGTINVLVEEILGQPCQNVL